MISINDVVIKPTIFPDGTSQIWHLPDNLLEQIEKDSLCTVVWTYSRTVGEVEFLWLAQLKTLLDTYTPYVHLEMSYCPYGRQDKRVDNNRTFALKTFAKLLNALEFDQVTVLDAHSARVHIINNLIDRSPKDFIRDALKASGANLILFPDAGAEKRYSAYRLAKHVTADKVRNQQTGAITGFSFSGNVKGKKVLIVDDLCDGGHTFCLAAEALYEKEAKEVYLYASHGLFTKGLQPLLDANILKIFTNQGELI